jgi:arsenate reductase-like glutaredoxin family protein
MVYTLYTIDGCTKCFKAKRFLENSGISYIEKNILHDVDARNELLKLLNEVNTPVLIDENKEVLRWNQIQSRFKLIE